MDADVVVVGTRLAGRVATCELADPGKWVVLLDRRASSLGRQALWTSSASSSSTAPSSGQKTAPAHSSSAWQDPEWIAGWFRLAGARRARLRLWAARWAGPTSSRPR